MRFQMPMALKDSGNWRIAAKPAPQQAPKTVAEKATTLAAACLLNAEAIQKGMHDAESRKTIGLERAWYAESNGKFFVTVSVAPGIPLVFVPGITKKNNAVACSTAKDAAQLYRDIAAALKNGELNAEVESGMAEASAVAKARFAKPKSRAKAKAK